MKKLIILIASIAAIGCTENKGITKCWDCETIVYVHTAVGYGIDTINKPPLCDKTEFEIREYEEQNTYEVRHTMFTFDNYITKCK